MSVSLPLPLSLPLSLSLSLSVFVPLPVSRHCVMLCRGQSTHAHFRTTTIITPTTSCQRL